MPQKDLKIDIIEFGEVKDVPLVIDDFTLAAKLGIRNRTLWYVIRNKNSLYKFFELKKPRGGKRAIHTPNPILKNLQKSILGRILLPIQLPNHVGAYVPKRSCSFTAKQHINKKIVINMDIKDFFTSTKRAMIRNYFNACVGYNYFVSSLLADLLTFENFVPQGAPTSGYITNLVALHRFDFKVKEFLSEIDKEWTYTRYSDDLAISHPDKQSKETVEKVIKGIEKIVRTAGFKINRKKTRRIPASKQQRILGIVVNEKINIPRLEYRRIRAMIHNCIMLGIDSQVERAGKENAMQLIQYIRGKISYFKQISPRKAGTLATEFERLLQNEK